VRLTLICLWPPRWPASSTLQNTRLENRTLPADDPEHHASRAGGDAFGLKSRNGGVRVDRSVVIQADREEHDFTVRTPSVLYTDSSAPTSAGGGRHNTYDQDADGMDDVSWDDRKLEGSQVELVKWRARHSTRASVALRHSWLPRPMPPWPRPVQVLHLLPLL
jgi:hypothetical protein